MLSTKNKVGLVIAGLLGLVDIPSCPHAHAGRRGRTAVRHPRPRQHLGVITVIAVVIGWTKANRGAIRVAAGARIVSMLTALPAFFVDVPWFIKILRHRRRHR